MKPRRVKISRKGGTTPPDRAPIAVEHAADLGAEHAVAQAVERRLAQARAEAEHNSWIQRALLVTAFALVATYVLTAIALDFLVDSERVRAWIEPRASAALNRVVTVGEARIDLVPRPSLRLADVTVANLAGFEGPALASLDEVRLDVSWLQLAIGRAVVERVHLEGPRVHLAISEGGVSNFGDLVPTRDAAADDASSAPFRAALRRVTMSHGSLSFFDASRDRSFMVSGGEGSADVAAGADGAWLADVALESDSLLVRLPSLSQEILRSVGPTTRVVIAGDAPLRNLGLNDGFIAVAGDTLLVSGRVAGLDGARPSFDVRLTNDRLSSRALEAAFSAESKSRLLPNAEGTLALTVQVQGGLSAMDRPVVRGVARLDGVALRLHGDLVADGVDGLVQFDSAAVEIQTLRGLFAGGPFELEGRVARDAGLSTRLSAKGRTDLDAVDRLGLLPEGLTLSGSGAYDVALTGSLRWLDSLEAVGTLTLDGAQVEHARLGAPLYVPAGIVTVDRRALQWSDMGVIVGTHPLVTSGEIDDLAAFRTGAEATPQIRLAVTGGHLDLDALFPPREGSSATYPELALAHVGGSTIDGRSARAVAQEAEVSRPLRVAAAGSILIDVDTLTYGEYRLEQVSTVMTLSDSAIAIPEAAFATWGGQGSASLFLGLGAQPESRFALSLRLDRVAASSFFAYLVPVTDGISGMLDADVEIEGLTDELLLPVGDSLAGRVRFVLREGRLAGTGVNHALADFLEATEWSEVPFDAWSAEFELQGPVAQLTRSELSGPFGRMVFGGAVGLGGDVDVSVALSLPSSQLAVVSLRRTGIGPGVVEQLRASGRALDLGLHMSGPLAAPVLEPNADNAVALARR